MITADDIGMLGKAGSIAIAISSIIGAFFWLLGLYKKVRRASARARKAEKERDEAIKLKEEAERLLANSNLEKSTFEAQATKAKQESERFLSAGRDEYSKRKKLELSLVQSEEEKRVLNCTIEALKKDLERYETQIESVANQDGRVWSAKLMAAVPEFVPLAKRHNRKPVVISLLNLKGGVGKTTLTANLGGYLAYHGERHVLLLDFDHQRSLTQLMFTTQKRQAAAAAGRTVQDFFLSDRGGKALRASSEQVPASGFERCWVVGNSDAQPGFGTMKNLEDLEMELLGKWLVNPSACDIRFLLRGAIHSEFIAGTYDYVLIDCPPRLTTACINALTASDYVLIPAQPEQMSALSVPHLLRRLRHLREAGILPELRILGVVGNMASADAETSTSFEAQVLAETGRLAKAVWGDTVHMLKSKIRDSNYYAKCQSEAAERLRLPSVVVEAIRKQYEKLTREIEGRIHEDLGTN